MVCAPVGRGGCYQQIYTALSGTDGGALGKGHAGSWASCAEMVRGSWAYWWLESCSGKRLLKHEETKKNKNRNQLTYPAKTYLGTVRTFPKSLPRYECSGVERWPWVGERADKLCVGEPGRLSLEDRDRFREDRLRLVCSRLDCFVIFLNNELRFLLQDRIRTGRGKTT